MEDSSVLFNLKEIMRLEHERIAAEVTAKEAAARAAHESALAAQRARELAERERLERAQRALREAEQAEHEAEAARAAALLRVQLDSEARERLEQQRLAHEHAQRVRALEVESRPPRRGLALAGLCAGLAAAAGLYVAVLQPQLGDLAARYDALTAQAAASSAEAQALEAQLAALRAQREREASSAQLAPAPPATPDKRAVTNTTRPRTTTKRVVTTTKPKADELDGLLDDADNDDPLGGLGDYPAKKKKK